MRTAEWAGEGVSGSSNQGGPNASRPGPRHPAPPWSPAGPHGGGDAAGAHFPAALTARPAMTLLQRLIVPRPLAWPFVWAGSMALAGLAFLLRIRVFTALPPLPMLFFLPAITLSAMMFGRRGGLIATATSTVLTTCFFVLPQQSAALLNRNALLSLGLFLTTGLFMTFIVEALRDAYLQAEHMRQQSQAAYLEAEAARATAAAGERERELLLVEFGHRVKNDLQRISGTFHLQAARAAPEAAAALQWAANQVNATAALHDHLAHRGGQVQVDVGRYLQDLVANLRASIGGERSICLRLDAESHTIPFDRAWMIGLIVNELVTNALKHAFPSGQPGTIQVGFHRDGACFLLMVGDDGIGLQRSASSTDASLGSAHALRSGLGHRLIQAMAAQLGGSVCTAPNGAAGTLHTLRMACDTDSAAGIAGPARAGGCDG